jgi:hypothetical protein
MTREAFMSGVDVDVPTSRGQVLDACLLAPSARAEAYNQVAETWRGGSGDGLSVVAVMVQFSPAFPSYSLSGLQASHEGQVPVANAADDIGGTY